MTPKRGVDLIGLAVYSLVHPRLALREILAIPTTRSELMMVLGLLIVINQMFALIITMALPAPAEGATENLPVAMAAFLLAVTIFASTFAMYYVGRMFGGTGSFDDCLKTVLWLNFVLFLLQVVVAALRFVSEEAAALGLTLVMVIVIVHLTALVMEVHGFTNVFLVLLCIFGTQMVFGSLFLILLPLIGVQIPIGPS